MNEMSRIPSPSLVAIEEGNESSFNRLLYLKGMRVSIPSINFWSHITNIDEQGIHVYQIVKPFQASQIYPAISYEEGKDVFVYPPEGSEYFGKMKRLNGPKRITILFTDTDREVAIDRNRIWQVVNSSHRKDLEAVLNTMKNG